jgi:hypothetical protein
MNAPLKPVAESFKRQAWAVMDGREKTMFTAKVCVMLATFGWIYGNTLAPEGSKMTR